VTSRGVGGNCGPLINLGSLVNGPSNDQCPVSTPDGKILLFDSDRTGGSGSKDIWGCTFQDVSG
jgi:Tol biopolymer transport system component